jgi:hypothetical protein
MNIANELKKPFPVNRIHWRVGATTKDKAKGIALAYIDARDVMQRLDEVVGMENWMCRYPFGGCCDIGIALPQKAPMRNAEGEMIPGASPDLWVWKSNGAGETNVEGEKGQYSDAFKRAGVVWGIGRYLYALPNVWVELDPYKKIVTPPTLPDWATPEGFEKIMEKRNE